MEHEHKMIFDVWDSQCDSLQVVNNATYQNYLEHARHQYLRTMGVDFGKLAREGAFLFVSRIEINYLHPLRGGNKCKVGTTIVSFSDIGEFEVEQSIYRLPDNKLVTTAKVFGVCQERGKTSHAIEKIRSLINSRNRKA